MRKLYLAALTYTVLGLVFGLYYREITKANDFTGQTELAVVHTHLLALGTLFFLIVIVLEKQFALSGTKSFTWFFWTYNAGLAWTVAFLAIHGTLTVLGKSSGAAIAGMAGLGHIILSAGFILFFVCLRRPLLALKK